MIKAYLKKADGKNSNPNGPIKKSVKPYWIKRVLVAEAGPTHSEIKKLLSISTMTS